MMYAGTKILLLTLSFISFGTILSAAATAAGSQSNLTLFDIFGSIINFLTSLINSLIRIVAHANAHTTTITSTTTLQTTFKSTTSVIATVSSINSAQPTTSTNTATVTSATSVASTSSATTSIASTSTSLSTTTINTNCNAVKTLLIGKNASCGQATVQLADLGQPNQTTGLSPATVLVYYNGVLTNATTINPYGTAAFGIGGSIVYVHVYQTVAGLYAYQKWANLSIGYNVPVTTMSTVTSTVSSTSSSTSSTTSISSNNQTGNGGGPGQLYLSESEAISLIGAGGTYGAINVSNPGQQYGVLNGNVTSYWLVGYTIRGFTTTTLISELVYKSPKAQFLYTAQLPQLLGANETVGAVNAISNGLTYSYVTWLGSYSRGSELIGYKNGEFVNIISPYELDQATLASVVAGDIP